MMPLNSNSFCLHRLVYTIEIVRKVENILCDTWLLAIKIVTHEIDG